MKKIISLLFVLSCLSIGVFASEVQTDTSIDFVNPITASTAYMNLETATPAQQEKILAARNEIMFNNSWTTEAMSTIYETPDGKVEILPLFSDLFPGWDVPKMNSTNSTADLSKLDLSTFNSGPVWKYYQVPTYLEKATDEFGPEVAYYNSIPGTTAEVVIKSLTSAKTCNVGFNDYWGKTLGHKDNMILGSSVKQIRLDPGQYLGVRASTYSTPSWATLQVGLLDDIYEVR